MTPNRPHARIPLDICSIHHGIEIRDMVSVQWKFEWNNASNCVAAYSDYRRNRIANNLDVSALGRNRES